MLTLSPTQVQRNLLKHQIRHHCRHLVSFHLSMNRASPYTGIESVPDLPRQPRPPFSPIQPGLPRKDAIRTEYHPKCDRKPEVKAFEDYGQDSPPPRRSYHPKPWLPFRSESEFSFSEIVHNASMSAGQIDALINVVRKMMEDHEEHFLLKSHKDLDELWSDATSKYAPVCPFSLSLLHCLIFKISETV